MTRIPLGSAQDGGFGTPYSAGYVERYELVGQGEAAERIARSRLESEAGRP